MVLSSLILVFHASKKALLCVLGFLPVHSVSALSELFNPQLLKAACDNMIKR